MLEKDTKVCALMFTGQGSQRVGMWDDLRVSPSARRTFQITDEIVGFSLSKLCSEGPIEKLTETKYAQPAIVAHSLAAFAVARELHSELFEREPLCVAGHSVGEYSALVVAEVINLETAIYLVRQRGLLMEEASRSNPGRMVALHRFISEEQVRSLCLKTGTYIANLNGPGQIIISGGIAEIENAVTEAKKVGIKPIPLEVSCAAHSPLMKPAQDEFKKVIADVKFDDPKTPVVPNVAAEPCVSGEEIKNYLVEQIVSPVRWHESVIYLLKQGIDVFIEYGPSPVLTGLLKRINKEAMGRCVKDYQSAEVLSF